jgi:hypothetical protein
MNALVFTEADDIVEHGAMEELVLIQGSHRDLTNVYYEPRHDLHLVKRRQWQTSRIWQEYSLSSLTCGKVSRP